MLQRRTRLKTHSKLKPGKPLKPRKPMKKRRKTDSRPAAEKTYYLWLLAQPCVVTGQCCEERHHLRLMALGAAGAKRAPHWFAVPVTGEGHREAHQRPRGSSHELAAHIPALWDRYGLEKVPEEMQERLRKYNYANS